MTTPLTADQVLSAVRSMPIDVREVPGWRERGRSRAAQKGWDPHWITVHHTAGGLGGRSVSGYIDAIINGDPQVPDKANAVIDPDGVLWLNAAGRANHQLYYSQQGFDRCVAGTMPVGGPSVDLRGGLENGNRFSYGVECIAAGTPNEAQRRTAVLWAAALAKGHGWSGNETIGHGELSDDRDFSDPGWPMGDFRRDVMACVRGDHPYLGRARPAPTPPATGVTGRIGERWRELGGPASPLGNPTTDEVRTERGAWRGFEGGFMLWSPTTDAHPSWGEIRNRYQDYGFEGGRLGYPTTDENPIKDGGRWQGFENGAIYWSPASGAHAVYGRIRERWGQLGWENGPLGYPVSDEFDGRKSGGRVQRFQGGVMYWTPAHDAHPVWGLVMERYTADGWEGGRWGYPTGDEQDHGGRWTQIFEGGTIEVGGGAPTPAPGPAQYVRPVKDPARHPITVPWRKAGGWARGYHTGVDIGCPVGTPVHATIGGDVRLDRRWGSAYGTHVVVNDDVDGSDWGYCHLSRIVVSDGQKVQTDQIIGYSGNTGRSFGPHLHLERRPRRGDYGSDLDPNRWP